MASAEVLIHENPDDPYRLTMRRDDHGDIRVIVSAAILPGGDPSVALAEARRRGELLVEYLEWFFRDDMGCA